ncbi:MAG: Ig-like domain-containing protein [Bacteroidota bacterium]
MQLNTYTACGRFFLTLFVLCTLFFQQKGAAQTENDAFDLRLKTEINCTDDVLTTTLQIRAQSDTFKIGTSSVLFTYNDTALTFIDYTSKNFDENNQCITGFNFPVWAAHKFNSAVSGTCNLTLFAEIPSASCPIVDTAWIDIGVARFTIKDYDKNPNIVFDRGNSSFNRHEPNDGTMSPDQGVFTNITTAFANECGCTPPTIRNDSLSSDCPLDIYTINIAANDVASNATFSISTDPSKGTATINSNGILSYVPAQATCFTDEFTYKVCSDGSADCCDEGTIFIKMEDTTSPTLLNVPDDLTVECGTSIDTAFVIASDNCNAVQLTMNETTSGSSDVCVGQQKITRTWTAIDACGNTASVSQTIEVVDTKEPILNCPDDITMDCGGRITPEALNSQATASDACSDVTLTFSDSEAAPDNCRFDQKTIIRTWKAQDACGNVAECTQEIILNGNPCPTTLERRVTAYFCENDTINLKEIINPMNGDLVVSKEENSEVISNPERYILPITGCEVGLYQFIGEVYNNDQCLVERTIVTVRTIPNFIADTDLSLDSCTAKLILECPDLYEVTWQAGDRTGGGTTFVASEGGRGTVKFTLQFKGITVPDSINLPCLSTTYDVAYSCPMPCPPSIQETINVVGCQGDIVNLRNRIQLSSTDKIESESISLNELAEYELKANGDSCLLTPQKHIIVVLDENNCPIREVTLNLTIIRPITGNIQHSDGFCKVALQLDCPQNYEVTWKNGLDSTGTGTIYEAAAGTSGFVEFYVNYKSDLIGDFSDRSCTTTTFAADYSCPADCPTTVAEDLSLTICGRQTLNLPQLLGLAARDRFVVEGIALDDGNELTFDNKECTIKRQDFGVKVFDVNDCLLQEVSVTATLLPNVEREIRRTNGNCDVALVLSCPNKFITTWEDSEGNTGQGTTFNGRSGTSGSVKFYVVAIDSSQLDSTNFACLNFVVEADFACLDSCPTTRNSEVTINACANTSIRLSDYLVLNDNLTYVDEEDILKDSLYQIGNPFGCESGTKNYLIEAYDEQQCLIEDIQLKINVFPAIYGEIFPNPNVDCQYDLALECPEKYTVTWEDTNGNSGEGTKYTARENNIGTVTYTVNYRTDEIILGDSSLMNCLTQTFTQRYDCTVECPDNQRESIEIIGCDDQVYDLFNRLDFSDNLRYRIIDNDQIDNIKAIKLENEDANCGISQLNLVVEVLNDDNCVTRTINVEFKVLPKIEAQANTIDGGCGTQLDLVCADSYLVTWKNSLGQEGTGLRYEAAPGTEGTITFFVQLKDSLLTETVSELCGYREYLGDFGCPDNTCPEKGTSCTDGDLATINDTHDGNCNCVGETVPEVKSQIDLRFRPTLDCAANSYCVDIQAKAQQEDFTIGTSSIMVNYNSDALEFANYTSVHFDEQETCIGGQMSPWDVHKIDGTSVGGKFCLTTTLNTAGASCPEITTTKWETIGNICFDVMDNTLSPDLTFDATNTHFNSASTNDGTALIQHGQLNGITKAEALFCEAEEVDTGNEVALTVILQGPYNATNRLMRDRLRSNDYIPLTEPYTSIPNFLHVGEGGVETIDPSVLEVTGGQAVVDWVFLELRSQESAESVVATRAALIQRDGDIVDIDGISNVKFNVPDGNYYVIVKHRNHLGVMTADAITFKTGEAVTIDFTDPNTPTYGNNAQFNFRGKMVLWGGNANPDKYILLAGGGLGLPDRDMIFFDIFLTLWYQNPGTPITYNSVLNGYYGTDTNMDGKVKYQGPKNDIDAIIFFNVLFHPENTRYRLNFAISEQIP